MYIEREQLGAEEVPAPTPAPQLAAPWALRMVGPGGSDLDIVHRWMNEPHVAAFWNQAWSRTQWSDYLAAQLTGDESRPYLVDYEAKPVAYVEIYKAIHHPIATHYDSLPTDLGLHIAIGEASLTGRGYGKEICRLLIGAIFTSDPSCRRIVAEPDIRNCAARRLFASLGMQLVGEFDLSYKRAALYICQRSPERLFTFSVLDA